MRIVLKELNIYSISIITLKDAIEMVHIDCHHPSRNRVFLIQERHTFNHK